jgi:hypothetical protein
MAGFSLGTFLTNLTHLRANELGHSALGNSIVNAVDNTLDPLLGTAVSGATGGLVTMTPTPAAPGTVVGVATSPLELMLENLVADLLQAALNSHYQSVGKATIQVAPAPTPTTKSVTPTPTPIEVSPTDIFPESGDGQPSDVTGFHPIGPGN